jgi:hypothetical protein
MQVFWILLAIGGALVLAGAAYNIRLERRRKRTV